MARSSARALRALVVPLVFFTLADAAPAGGGSERAVLVVDPASAESMYVANVYASRRGLLAANFAYMAPGAANYAQFAATNLPALLGELANRGIDDHVDFALIPPGGNSQFWFRDAAAGGAGLNLTDGLSIQLCP